MGEPKKKVKTSVPTPPPNPTTNTPFEAEGVEKKVK